MPAQPHRAGAGRALPPVVLGPTAGSALRVTSGDQTLLDIPLDALRRPWRAEDRSIDQLVFLLRSKIMPGEKKHHFIQTVRGAGYRLVLPN